MKSKLWDASAEPQVLLQVNGNLKLSGWDRQEIQARAADPDAITYSPAGDAITIRTTDDCVLQVPAGTRLQVESVYGNATIEGITGPLEVETIGGNLNLQHVGTSEIAKVYGNLKASQVLGDLQVGAVYGNTTTRDVRGAVLMEEEVKGNLVVRQANRVEASALGNATVLLAPAAGDEIRVEASGNIHCTLMGGAGARVDASSQACQIRLRTDDATRTIEDSRHEFALGEGGARIRLSAKGFIHLTEVQEEGFSAESEEDMAWDAFSTGAWAGISEDASAISNEINQLIEQQMDALETRLTDHLSKVSELGTDSELRAEVDEIVEQARQYSARAAQRAQERAQAAAERAQSKLSRKLEKARRKAERKARKTGVRARSASGRPGAGQPASEQEHLMILKMLEEEKITLEEADALLAALEGSEG